MLRSSRWRILALALFCSGCSAPASPTTVATAPSSSRDADAGPAAAATVATTRADGTSPGHGTPTSHGANDASLPGETHTLAPLVRLAEVQRVVHEPIFSLALEPQQRKVAALGQQPWLYDGESWKPIPLPAHLRAAQGERDEARIYFGRDYQPRIMGARFGPDGPRQLYLRFRFGTWRDEQREQAAFAGRPHAALYGWLGWDDPEVLCKVGGFCLIKQRSGWSQVPLPVASPQTPVRIDVSAAGAYALLDRQLLRLGKERWIPVGGEGLWQGKPGGAWIQTSGGWVSAPEQDALYEHDGRSWQRHRSPVRQPRGLWAGSDDELWIAGSNGAGYSNRQRFWRVEGIAGPLVEVIGKGDRLWFGGPGGVWSARRPSTKAP